MIEYIKIAVSALTPLTVLAVGILINRRLEKNKIEILKEKEWQIHWADRFLKTAHELNANISLLIFSLFEKHNATDDTDFETINKKIKKYFNLILENEWDLKNDVQFATKNRDEVLTNLQNILDGLRRITEDRQGNIEPIREHQFEFNKSVRNAHAEILNIKTVNNIVYKQ